jgi:hypothetical protein
VVKRIVATGLALAIALGGLSSALADDRRDYDVPGGHFFTQTGGGAGLGYAVVDGQGTDGRQIRFWSEYKRLGGIDTLAYPVGRPYSGPGGFTYQAFQRGVLQWRPERNGAVLSNTFEWLHTAGKDAWLIEAKGIPEPIMEDGSGGDYAKAVSTRLGWLTEPAIKAKFLANPNPAAISGWNQDRAIEMYGLPMSRPEKHGPFIAQRFQRIAFQLWVEDVPGMPSKGKVVAVLGGDLLKGAGELPAASVNPLGPGGIERPEFRPTPTPVPPPVAPGAYPWRYEMKSWSPNCGTTYVFGHVYNRDGSLRNGISVKTWNDWGNVVITGSGTDINRGDGGWARLVNNQQNPQTWYAAIVDASGNQASPMFTVKFDADCTRGAQVVELDFHEN